MTEGIDMDDWKKILIDCYVSRNAVAIGTFELKSGEKSDLYIDGRRVTTHPIGLQTISRAMIVMIKK